MDLCLNRIRLRPVIVAFLQSFEWSGEPGIAIVPGMMTPYPTSLLPPLRPVSRRHLLQLQVAPVTLRPFQRADLPAWRLFDDRRRRGRRHPAGIDEEARFLAHMHRSRLITVTGDGPSTLARGMREPVTFTSCNVVGALSCAKAGSETSIRDDSASTSGRGRSALGEAYMGFLGGVGRVVAGAACGAHNDPVTKVS